MFLNRARLSAAKRMIPAAVRRRISRLRRRELTIAEGWDEYAQRYEAPTGQHLGDEWTNPADLGLGLPRDEVLPYLDEHVFGPFLGRCDVLLEIGAGGGRFTELLLPRCNRLIALDTSPAMLELLRDRFGDDPKIDYRLGDGTGLGFLADHSVDAAFAYGVFVHLQHWDIYNYLVELRRVFRRGGRAVIQHANTFSELGWKKFLDDLQPSLGRHKLPGSFTVMTPELMGGFVARAGLRLEACVTDVVPRDGISLIRA